MELKGGYDNDYSKRGDNSKAGYDKDYEYIKRASEVVSDYD